MCIRDSPCREGTFVCCLIIVTAGHRRPRPHVHRRLFADDDRPKPLSIGCLVKCSKAVSSLCGYGKRVMLSKRGCRLCQSLPRVPVWHKVWSWIVTGFALGCHILMQARLIQRFCSADLRRPRCFSRVRPAADQHLCVPADDSNLVEPHASS